MFFLTIKPQRLFQLAAYLNTYLYRVIAHSQIVDQPDSERESENDEGTQRQNEEKEQQIPTKNN